METKKDILARTYIIFIGLLLFCLSIVGKVLYIQLAEGTYWTELADKARIKLEQIEAERGTIYSDDGAVLSTSIPEFDIYVDYMADGLREKEGMLFKENVDSLSQGLAKIFKDKKASQYKKLLQKGYRGGERYALLKRKISFTEYEALKKLPLVRLGKNKSGFIAEVRMKRLYPFKLMANRTIGIARDSNKVGLEKKYDRFLNGTTGSRLVRYIAGGTGVPIEGNDTEPQDGLDVVTNLDVGIQDIAHQALERMMVDNEAIYGTCIVMEVKTGKVKAIANLGRQSDGSYWEDYNYALAATEPGSTWKLTTLMAVLEEKAVTNNSIINLEGGRWNVSNRTVFDSEIHGLHQATVQQAFEKSSNVGMAKLAYYYFNNKPSSYFRYLHKWHMDTITGVDLPGEGRPRIYKPGNRMWSSTTLPWMGFGYNLTITPLQTAMLYNAVANGGKMMKPYLVNSVLKEGELMQQFDPVVLDPAICSPETLLQVKQCLEGVVLRGTASKLQSPAYSFAGKTGTSLVADKGISYADKMYQSSFAGYFPADNPAYTIVVVIRNKKHAPRFYGGVVAGPVFREVADRLYAGYLQQYKPFTAKTDSISHLYTGTKKSLEVIATELKMPYKDSTKNKGVAHLITSPNHNGTMLGSDDVEGLMPELKGVGLKDALKICEENGWYVAVKGVGRVSTQSIAAGSTVKKGQKITLTLN
jgi:cell division protein FtsI (penicillin-binding protein 3)